MTDRQQSYQFHIPEREVDRATPVVAEHKPVEETGQGCFPLLAQTNPKRAFARGVRRRERRQRRCESCREQQIRRGLMECWSNAGFVARSNVIPPLLQCSIAPTPPLSGVEATADRHRTFNPAG
jgi:hypothetical protein